MPVTNQPTSNPSVIVHIADDVVAAVAAHAILEVPHVLSLQPSAVRGLTLGRAPEPGDGVHVTIGADRSVHLEADVGIELGAPLPEVASQIQTHVIERLAASTGLSGVVTVNIVAVSEP